jgi:iron(III) transport system substrate-binding protein
MEGLMHARIFARLTLLLALLAAVAVALVAASAGTSATAKSVPPSPIRGLVASLKGLSLSAREAKLLNLAKQEGGQVNVYTSLSSLVTKAVQSAWAQRYPDVKLNLYRAANEDVVAKLMAEHNAKAKGADIVESQGTSMLFLQHKKDVLIPYRLSPYATAIPKADRFDTFTADRIEKFVVAWNTNLVPAGQQPKSYLDLADPKWKGKIAIDDGDADWFAALYTYLLAHGNNGKAMAAKQLDSKFAAIMRNTQVINGHTTQATLEAAGQISVLIAGHAQSIEQLQAKGAPIAFAPFVRPVVQRPQGEGIPYTLSHPGAALLFYDWLLSPAAQKILQSNGVEPANPAFPDNAFTSNPTTVTVQEEPIVSHWASWVKKFASFTNLASGTH